MDSGNLMHTFIFYPRLSSKGINPVNDVATSVSTTRCCNHQRFIFLIFIDYDSSPLYRAWDQLCLIVRIVHVIWFSILLDWAKVILPRCPVIDVSLIWKFAVCMFCIVCFICCLKDIIVVSFESANLVHPFLLRKGNRELWVYVTTNYSFSY